MKKVFIVSGITIAVLIALFALVIEAARLLLMHGPMLNEYDEDDDEDDIEEDDIVHDEKDNHFASGHVDRVMPKWYIQKWRIASYAGRSIRPRFFYPRNML